MAWGNQSNATLMRPRASDSLGHWLENEPLRRPRESTFTARPAACGVQSPARAAPPSRSPTAPGQDVSSQYGEKDETCPVSMGLVRAPDGRTSVSCASGETTVFSRHSTQSCVLAGFCVVSRVR